MGCGNSGVKIVEIHEAAEKDAVREVVGVPPSPKAALPPEDEDWSWQRVILGYNVRGTDILGVGNFSVLRRGVHTSSGQSAAIKCLKSGDEAKFRREVTLFKYLHGDETLASPFTRTSSLKHQNSFVQASSSELLLPQASSVLVKMLAHSPLDDPSDGMYLALELSQCSLHDLVINRYDAVHAGHQAVELSLELQRVLLHVASGLLLLHSMQLVHGDLKPGNVMWFGDQNAGAWKLIDLDGLLHASDDIDVSDTDFFTLTYAAPELAKAAWAKQHLRISRLLDVWSLGMMMLEMELLEPPLRAKHRQCCELDDGNGDARFLEWLATTIEPLVLPDTPRTLPEGIKHLLQNQILVKDDSRVSIPALLQLPACNQAFGCVPPPCLLSLEPVEQKVQRPKTAWQLYQDAHAQELKDEGLTGGKLTQELHKRWKLLLKEGGTELDDLRAREAELEAAAAVA